MSNAVYFSWIIRLLWNLYGYSTVLLPIGIIVYMVKHKHCLPSFSNLTVIRLLVYGKDVNSLPYVTGDIEQSRSLLIINDKKETKLLNDGGEGYGQPTRREKFILFLTCFFGLHCSYLIWGVYQEKIMTTEYFLSVNSTQFMEQINDPNVKILKGEKIKFHDSQFLVLVGRIFALALSSIVFIYTSARRKPTVNSMGKPDRLIIAPLYEFFYSSLSNILSSWCQYEALKYVNFPTQVLSKACKIPTVMLMSGFVSKRQYDRFDYTISFFISAGMFTFLHGTDESIDHRYSINHHSHATLSPSLEPKDSTLNPSLSLQTDLNNLLINPEQQQHVPAKAFSGLIVLALYLIFDSFTSNWEESLFHRYQISSWQMMVSLNLCSIILTLTSLTEQGNLVPALITITSSNQLFHDVIYMALSSTIGQFFVFYTISNFGALIFTMIMTLRQIFAILLSIIIYHHSISIESTIGIIIVFISLITLRLVRMNKVKK